MISKIERVSKGISISLGDDMLYDMNKPILGS